MFSILGWIIAGLVIGAIARLLMPGRQPMGIFMTIALGIAGALVGGFVSWAIWGQNNEPFSEYAWPGYIFSVVGAILLLAIFGAMSRRSRV